MGRRGRRVAVARATAPGRQNRRDEHDADERQVLHRTNLSACWWYSLSFIFATSFVAALPVLLVLLLGKRAEVFLPKVRDWMSANSWIISGVILVFFIAIEINSIASS
ncbi:MAG TPA: GAP family protein [Gaiellaceae bacterium]